MPEKLISSLFAFVSLKKYEKILKQIKTTIIERKILFWEQTICICLVDVTVVHTQTIKEEAAAKKAKINPNRI
jgi:hypothetical protein